jgi:FeS assembly SUF system protein
MTLSAKLPLTTMDAHQPTAPPEPGLPANLADLPLHDQVVAVLKTCYDPEIPVNIHELGLVYGIDIDPTGAVLVKMTLTSPACPVAGSLPGMIEGKLKALPNVASAKVEVVWDPPWTPEKMSEGARLQLGFF